MKNLIFTVTFLLAATQLKAQQKTYDDGSSIVYQSQQGTAQPPDTHSLWLSDRDGTAQSTKKLVTGTPELLTESVTNPYDDGSRLILAYKQSAMKPDDQSRRISVTSTNEKEKIVSETAGLIQQPVYRTGAASSDDNNRNGISVPIARATQMPMNLNGAAQDQERNAALAREEDFQDIVRKEELSKATQTVRKNSSAE